MHRFIKGELIGLLLLPFLKPLFDLPDFKSNLFDVLNLLYYLKHIKAQLDPLKSILIEIFGHNLRCVQVAPLSALPAAAQPLQFDLHKVLKGESSLLFRRNYLGLFRDLRRMYECIIDWTVASVLVVIL